MLGQTPSAQPAPPPSAAQQAEPVSNGMQPGDSHARIVRLSEAEGRLVLDRGTGKPEATMQNMPIVERARLATGDGFAEVEFEDGSTLRLPPESQVDFPRLILRHSGAKATTVKLVKGTVYINLQRTKDNDFLVETGNTVMTVTPSTHMRLETANGKATLTVFEGDVEMRSGSASTSVGKKHSVSFDPIAPPETVEVAKKVQKTPYDEWDKRSLEFHDHYMNAKGYSSSPYAYGISDLNYYGGFINAGGCGTMWRPYFTSIDWDPYGNGVWAWYRGAGYSWVSPYPWGWLPYHLGSWAFCPGVGWGWQPGASWYGLANYNPGIVSHPIPSNPSQPGRGIIRGGIPLRPPGPVHATGAPHNTLVIANRSPMIFSHMDRVDNFVFRKDSAGLGVPRGDLGNLHTISNHVERNGSVNRQVYTQLMGGFHANGSPVHTSVPVMIHSGAPYSAGGGPGAWPAQAAAFQGRTGNLSGGGYTGPAQNSSAAFQGGAAAGASAGGFHGGGMPAGNGGFHGGGGNSGNSSAGGHK